MNYQPALLALADGSVFHGSAIGASGSAVGEVVFNTAMTGYQEILTDPSYCQQMVTLTYPHVGNVGVNPEDVESAKVQAAGLIIRERPLPRSNWRSQANLDTYLREHNLVAIADIDTRRLTRILREKGAQNGCIMAGEVDEAMALARARAFPGLKGADLAKVVSTVKTYEWAEPTWAAPDATPITPRPRFHVAVYDFGVKYNILRSLVDAGCRVTVVPAQTSAEAALALQPDGILMSNGPGDPDPCDYAISATRSFIDKKIPLFGICLGHQILALACGARTMKLKFGHHGANHPVQDMASGRVMITSQNHGFAVDESSLPATLTPTHRSLFDGTLQGMQHSEAPAFSFQGHPEASPGPHDVAPLFTRFVELMEAHRA